MGKFDKYTDPTGPYFLTAVNQVEPYINALPCDPSAYEVMEAALMSRDAALYNNIENYQGKRGKGALLAIYRYLDVLKLTVSSQSGGDVLDKLQTFIQELLCIEPKQIVSRREELLGGIKSNLQLWMDNVTVQDDVEKVSRVYQTSFLTFRMLHLRLGEWWLINLPYVKCVRQDLLDMMDLLKKANQQLFDLKEKEAEEKCRQEKALIERREKEKEANAGIFEEFKGAEHRAREKLLESIDSEKQVLIPKMNKVDLLIDLIESIGMYDNLQTFWARFKSKSRAEALMALLQLNREERESWALTFSYHRENTANSLLYALDWNAAEIDQSRLEREAVLASNRLLKIMVTGKLNALVNLKRSKQDYEKGESFPHLKQSKEGLDEIKEEIKRLPRLMLSLSPLPRPKPVLEEGLFSDDAKRAENAAVLFKDIMAEINDAREQLKEQQVKIEACLAFMANLKKLIDKVYAPYNEELKEKYSRLVHAIYFTVFEEKSEGSDTFLLKTLSEAHPEIIDKINFIKKDQISMAQKFDQTEASKRLEVLDNFLLKTRKGGWHWLFYWLSPTYRHCYKNINKELLPFRDKPAQCMDVFGRINQSLKKSEEQTFSWSPCGMMVRKMSHTLQGYTFFGVVTKVEVQETQCLMDLEGSKQALVL